MFLRDDDIAGLTVDASEGATKPGQMTHAGATFEERTRRMLLSVEIIELSLALHGRTLNDPIVLLRAVNAQIKNSQFPDLGKSSTTVNLQNLFCEDSRDIAQSRQYRPLAIIADISVPAPPPPCSPPLTHHSLTHQIAPVPPHSFSRRKKKWTLFL